MIAWLLERLAAWLPRSCTFELTGPVIVQDGSAWLRISPGEPPRWFREEWQALAYG